MTWIEYGMQLAFAAATKSKDPWRKVGAVAFRKDNSVAGVGYNGYPTGMFEDWDDREGRRQFVIHAEANALRYCRPGEVYLLCCTTLPCNECLRSAAAYGINTIAYSEKYENDPSTIELAFEFAIELVCAKSM